jgi:DNA topoisomerase I
VFLRMGRFGPYVQCGTAEDDEKKNASLMRGMKPEDVTLEVALKLLSLPRTLGEHPQTHEPVVAQNGRYGPFIKCGNETRSLPDSLSPLEVTLEQALQLLAQPKGGRGRGASKEPLKVFDASPVTGQPVRLLAGRYGPYVADGVTNASLPRGTAPEEVTFEYALSLLKARAERGPVERPTRRRAAAKTAKAPAKKAVKKSAKKTTKAAKKTAKRKATKASD